MSRFWHGNKVADGDPNKTSTDARSSSEVGTSEERSERPMTSEKLYPNPAVYLDPSQTIQDKSLSIPVNEESSQRNEERYETNDRSAGDDDQILELEREPSLIDEQLYPFVDQETFPLEVSEPRKELTSGEEARPIGVHREGSLTIRGDKDDKEAKASMHEQMKMSGGNPVVSQISQNDTNGEKASQRSKVIKTSGGLLPNKHLLACYDRVRSANKIKVKNPRQEINATEEGYVSQKKKEKTEETEKGVLIFNDLTELFDGTEQQVLYRVNMLIHQHVEVNDLKPREKDGDNFGILHHAVINKFVTVAEKLIDNGATLLDQDSIGFTPLHYALGKYNEHKTEVKHLEEEKTKKQIEASKRKDKTEIQEKATKFDDKVNYDDKTELLKRNSKCDEMAALLISKLKPYRVREMFGDFTDNEKFIKNENVGKNARFQIPRTRSLNLEIKDPVKTEQLKPLFQFIEVVKDKKLQETARTILNKLQDVDPVENQQKVYVKLLLEEDQHGQHQRVFHYITKHRSELANHPVCRALIKHKWNEWAFSSYLFDTILYFLSFIALTICTVVGAQSDGVFIYDSPWQYTRLALEILMCLFILRAFYTETLQLFVDPTDYVKSIMNWIELGSAIVLIVDIGLRAADKNAHWFVFAVGYVLWTVKGLKYASVTSHTAAYSETLRSIMIRDFWLFALFFVAIEMLFGGTYLLVLKWTNNLDISEDTTTILGIYYVGLRTMIEGNFPIENYDTFPKSAQAVIISFMALTIVVMLNILIAQLSNTYQTAYAEGRIKAWINRAEAIANFEMEDSLKDKILSRSSLFGCLWFRNTNQKKEKEKEEEKYKLDFNKEEMLEEKEKMDEMRSTLKQLDSKLIHADLTIQTIKTRQNLLIQTVQGENNKDKENNLYREITEMKNILFKIEQSNNINDNSDK